MVRADHDGHQIEDGVIDLRLRREAVQRVRIALDLVTMEFAVDYRQIDPCAPCADAEFLDD
jgi:hypothetical protein